MASDNDVSCCESDPNFAVICAFIEKFGVACGLSNIDFVELQGMLENTQEVSPRLIDLHVKLMRKARKSVTSDKWEKIIVKICHTFCTQDAWEVERFGYKNAKLSSKVRILKELLEMQFDYFTRFKTDVNKTAATDLRTQPLGRDKFGNLYWFLGDDNYQIKVYKEDPENGNLELVAKDKDSLFALISDLNDEETRPFTKKIETNENEESNDNSTEKPLMDTGQSDTLSQIVSKKVTDEDKDSTVRVETSADERSEIKNISQPPTPTSDVPPKNADLKIDAQPEEPKITLKLRPLADLQKSSTSDSDSSINSDKQPIKRAKIEKIRIRNISSGNAEISEVIEDPPVIVTGEGSGHENEGGNSPHLEVVGQEVEEDVFYFYGHGSGVENLVGYDRVDKEAHLNTENCFDYEENLSGIDPIVGQEIVESPLYVYGYGSGIENFTGNDSKPEENDLKSDGDGSVLSENRTLKTSDNSVSRSDMTEGEVIDDTLLQQGDPTSPVKNPYKLGTILDIKTDKGFSPKLSVRKSRWDVGNSGLEPSEFEHSELEPSELEPSELDTALSSELTELKNDITPGKVKDLVDKFEELADSNNSKSETQSADSSTVNSTFFFGPGSSPFKYTHRDDRENLAKGENHQDATFLNDVDKTQSNENESDIAASANGIIRENTINEEGDTMDENIDSSKNEHSNSDIENNSNEMLEETQVNSEEMTAISSNEVSGKSELADIQDTNDIKDSTLDQNVDDDPSEPTVCDANEEANETLKASTSDVSDVKVSSTSDACISPTDLTHTLDIASPNAVDDCTVEDVVVSNAGESICSLTNPVTPSTHVELSDVDSSISCDVKEQENTKINMEENTETKDYEKEVSSNVVDPIESLLPSKDASALIESSVTSLEIDGNTTSTDKSEITDDVDSSNANEECGVQDSEMTPMSSIDDMSSANILKDDVPILAPENPVDDIYSAVDGVCSDNMLSDINHEQVSEDVLGDNLSSEDVNIGTGDEPSNIIDFDDLPASNLLVDDASVDIIPMDEAVPNEDSGSSINIVKDADGDDTNKDCVIKPQLSDNLNLDDILQDKSLPESTLAEDSTLLESKSEDVSLDAMLSGDIVSKDVSSPENSLVNPIDESKELPGGGTSLDQLADDLGTNQMMNDLLPENEASTDVSDLEAHMNDFPVTADNDVTSSVGISVESIMPSEVCIEKQEEKDSSVSLLEKDLNGSPKECESDVPPDHSFSVDVTKNATDNDVPDVGMPFDSVPADSSPPVDMFASVTPEDVTDPATEKEVTEDLINQDASYEVTDEKIESSQDTQESLSHNAANSFVVTTKPDDVPRDASISGVKVTQSDDVVSDDHSKTTIAHPTEVQGDETCDGAAVEEKVPAATLTDEVPIDNSSLNIHSSEDKDHTDEREQSNITKGFQDNEQVDNVEPTYDKECISDHSDNDENTHVGEHSNEKDHIAESAANIGDVEQLDGKCIDNEEYSNSNKCADYKLDKVLDADREISGGHELTDNTEGKETPALVISSNEEASDSTSITSANDTMKNSEPVRESGESMEVDERIKEKENSTKSQQNDELTDRADEDIDSAKLTSNVCGVEPTEANKLVEDTDSEKKQINDDASSLNIPDTIENTADPEESQVVQNLEDALKIDDAPICKVKDSDMQDEIVGNNDRDESKIQIGESKDKIENINVNHEEMNKSNADESKVNDVDTEDKVDNDDVRQGKTKGNDVIEDKPGETNANNDKLEENDVNGCKKPNTSPKTKILEPETILDSSTIKDTILEKTHAAEHEKLESEKQLESSELEGTTSENKGTDAENKGTDAENKGTDAENKGTDAETKGTDAENKGTDAENKGTDANQENIPEDKFDLATKSSTDQESKRRSTRYSGKDSKHQDVKEKPKKSLTKGKQAKTDISTRDDLVNEENTEADNSEPGTNVDQNKQEESSSEGFQPVVVVERTAIGNKEIGDKEAAESETKISTRRSGRFVKENKDTNAKVQPSRRATADVNKEEATGRGRRSKESVNKDQHNEISTDSDSGRRKSDVKRKRGRPKANPGEVVEDKAEHSTDEGSDRPLRGGRRSSNITPNKQKEELKSEQSMRSKKVKLTEDAVKPAETRVSRRGRPRNNSPQETTTKQKLTVGSKKSKGTTLSTTPQKHPASRGSKGLRSSSSGSTPVASPQVVSVECDSIIDNCGDLTEIQERDPLAVTESDPESSKASFSTPHNDSSNSRTRRSLRKRGLDSPENIPDSDEAFGKKPKLKGKRSTDLHLRRSIEEKKRAQVVSSSEEDVSVLTDSNSTQENKTKSPPKRGRKSKTPQKKTAHTDSPTSEMPQPSKKKKIIETRNSKSKKR